MKAKVFVLLVALCSIMALSVGVVSAQPDGFSVTCDNGAEFSNGVEIIVTQMRAGFTYTATAIGINGFDPVLAVLNEDGDGLCNDDSDGARRYAADLPSTGEVDPSSLSAQVDFSHDDPSGFLDISLVVGGFGNTTGEFVLIIEGMGVTAGDNAGDPFSVNLTPMMVSSGVPLSVYMLTRGQSSVDPIIYLSDGDDGILEDGDGNPFYCDDSGSSDLCYGDSVALDNYSVTINSGTLPGWQYDAALSLDISQVELSEDPDDNFLTFYMTSYEGSEGQYLLAFHMGIAEAGSAREPKYARPHPSIPSPTWRGDLQKQSNLAELRCLVGTRFCASVLFTTLFSTRAWA